MDGQPSTRRTLLGEAAILLATAVEKLDLAACETAAIRASQALDIVQEQLAAEGGDTRAPGDG